METTRKAPLTPGDDGVLAGGHLPALLGRNSVLVEVFDHGPEAPDLVVEPVAFDVNEACEPVLSAGCGGGGVG